MSISETNISLTQFQTSIRNLQDDILAFYLDFFIFNTTILFINGYFMWGLSINVPVIILLTLKFLTSYIVCKSQSNNLNYVNRFLSMIDNIC